MTPARIAHVVDETAGWDALAAAALLAESEPHCHVIITVGRARDWLPALRGAARTSTGLIPGPGRLAGRPVARAIAELGDGAHAVAWSERALELLDAAPRTPRSAALLRLIPPTRSRAAATRLEGCSAVLVGSAVLAQRLSDAKIAAEPIDLPPLLPRRRASVLADGPAAGRLLIAALGGLGDHASADSVSYQVGVLTVSGRDAAAISSRHARDVDRAARLADHHAGRWPVFVVPSAEPALGPAVDAAVWHPSRGAPAVSSPASAIEAASRGIPVVSSADPVVTEALGAGGFFDAAAGSRPELNRALYRCVTDDAERSARVAAASGHVRDRAAGRPLSSCFAALSG